MQSLDIFRRYDVVLCDIDGVLHSGEKGVAGVPELLAALRRDGPRLLFLTNNGSALPEQIAAGLRGLGLDLGPDDLVTAGETLAQACPSHGLVGELVINVGNEPAAEYIRRAGAVPLPPSEARRRYGEARAVVVGSTRDLHKDVLDAACNAVRRHALPVLCTNPDAFAPDRDGEITLVAGGLANLLERELGANVIRLGKPYRPIFDLALERLRDRVVTPSPRVLVVDDNLDSGIRGGHDLGYDTLLVLSGWVRSRADAEQSVARLGIRPTYILESVVS
jgi:HAD superfamily hydrolase (TIGR01450 family)